MAQLTLSRRGRARHRPGDAPRRTRRPDRRGHRRRGWRVQDDGRACSTSSGPKRVIDTPIAEQAILGAAMGAAMTGLRPVAEIMFSDFFAVCWDLVVNEIAKTRYMTERPGHPAAGHQDRQRRRPAVRGPALAVDRELGDGRSRASRSSPRRRQRDVVGLMAAAIRGDDPVLFFEHKGLYAAKGEVPDGDIVDALGTAKVRRPGTDATILALGLMVPRALDAAEQLAAARHRRRGDRRALARAAGHADHPRVGGQDRAAVHRRGEPARCSAGAPRSPPSPRDECFWDLDGPVQRITTPHIPLPSADSLEDLVMPSADQRRHDGGEGPAVVNVDTTMPPLGETVPERAAVPRHRHSPRVRRLARESGVDLERLIGTGPAGRVTVADVAQRGRHPRAGP